MERRLSVSSGYALGAILEVYKALDQAFSGVTPTTTICYNKSESPDKPTNNLVINMNIQGFIISMLNQNKKA